MTDYCDETELATYVWKHYAELFTPLEAKAGLAALADAKADIGHKVAAESIWKRHALADDPAMSNELADGVEAFRLRTVRRVLQEHGDRVFVNRCPNCHRVARTPKAQQCIWCGSDWHSTSSENISNVD